MPSRATASRRRAARAPSVKYGVHPDRGLAAADVPRGGQADGVALLDGRMVVVDAVDGPGRGADEHVRTAVATTPAGSGWAGVAPSAPVEVAGAGVLAGRRR